MSARKKNSGNPFGHKSCKSRLKILFYLLPDFFVGAIREGHKEFRATIRAAIRAEHTFLSGSTSASNSGSNSGSNLGSNSESKSGGNLGSTLGSLHKASMQPPDICRDQGGLQHASKTARLMCVLLLWSSILGACWLRLARLITSLIAYSYCNCTLEGLRVTDVQNKAKPTSINNSKKT